MRTQYLFLRGQSIGDSCVKMEHAVFEVVWQFFLAVGGGTFIPPLPPPPRLPLFILAPQRPEEPQPVPRPHRQGTRDLQASCRASLRTTWAAWPACACPTPPASPSTPSQAPRSALSSNRPHRASVCPHMFVCPSSSRIWSTCGFWGGHFPVSASGSRPSLMAFCLFCCLCLSFSSFRS